MVFGTIKESTKNMNRTQKLQYIMTYYWYHILGICAVVGLIVFLIVHFAFPEEKPLFTCALINQKIDYEQDENFAKEFADVSGLSKSQIVFDSDYIISYDGNKQDGNNESSFDKFFFQWSGGELDAIIADEDFLTYCVVVGGEFYRADEFDTDDLTCCTVAGVSAIQLKETEFDKELAGTERDELVLAFPKTGSHKEICQKFIDYLKGQESRKNR